MVRQIITQTALLREKSQQATEADRQAAQDLADTLEAHREHCVGMAANMIGILKNIIAVSDNGKILVMYNPVIIRRDKPFETREGCLSLSGTRPTLRYKEITVSYQDERFANVTKKFVGCTAQIIQHETDHCNGIII